MHEPPPGLPIFVMLAAFPEPPCGLRREADQRALARLRDCLGAALTSCRARLSRKSCITISPGTIRPAANSASLSASASSRPAGATTWGTVSFLGGVQEATFRFSTFMKQPPMENAPRHRADGTPPSALGSPPGMLALRPGIAPSHTRTLCENGTPVAG